MLSAVELAAEVSAPSTTSSSRRAASGRASQEPARVLFVDGRDDTLKLLEGANSFHGLVGKSAAMRNLYRLLERAAGLDITVLLAGETGTGKELAARAVHCRSARRERPFVPVNCAALPSELIESELFGYVKGAFTGAAASRRGLFEEAEGGTVFLDEIGELPLSLQVKLNRVLQEKEIRRVGDSRTVKIDVRVVAATYRDLKAEVAAGRFREDLFYRLHVFPVCLPPLRNRRDDIPLLAKYFLERHARAQHRVITGFAPEALRALLDHPWPGNVRELENAIERAGAVASTSIIERRDLPPELTATSAPATPLQVLPTLRYRDAMELARARASRDYLATVLEDVEGNVTRAAERAGMARETFHRLSRRFGIRPEDFRRR